MKLTAVVLNLQKKLTIWELFRILAAISIVFLFTARNRNNRSIINISKNYLRSTSRSILIFSLGKASSPAFTFFYLNLCNIHWFRNSVLITYYKRIKTREIDNTIWKLPCKFNVNRLNGRIKVKVQCIMGYPFVF